LIGVNRGDRKNPRSGEVLATGKGDDILLREINHRGHEGNSTQRTRRRAKHVLPLHCALCAKSLCSLW